MITGKKNIFSTHKLSLLLVPVCLWMQLGLGTCYSTSWNIYTRLDISCRHVLL